MDNILDGLNFDNDKFDENLDQLTELVFTRLIETYGPIYPLNFGIDEEEILISELARLSTILCILEKNEEFEKCTKIKIRMENIYKKLEEL